MTKQGEDLYHYNKQNNRKKYNKLCEVYIFLPSRKDCLPFFCDKDLKKTQQFDLIKVYHSISNVQDEKNLKINIMTSCKILNLQIIN